MSQHGLDKGKEMDAAYVSAFAALGGSVVGGLISGVAMWRAQRYQSQAGQRAHQITYREELFRDFIVAASKAYGRALMSNEPDLQDIIGMFSLINIMQFLCLPATTACAQHVTDVAIETYKAYGRALMSNEPDLQDIIGVLYGTVPLDPECDHRG